MQRYNQLSSICQSTVGKTSGGIPTVVALMVAFAYVISNGPTESARAADVATDGSVRPITISVDVSRGLSFGDRSTFRRHAYFNIHGSPTELSAAERAWLVDDLRANFGRSMGAVSSFFAGLKPDKNRPGFADPESLTERATEFARRAISPTAGSLDHVQLVNSVHPYSYFGKNGKPNETEFFVPGSHEAAAEVLTAFFQSRAVENESYFEVANECNVKARKLGTTMDDWCDLHVDLAAHLHERVPGLQVGGPTSAWPAFEVNNFRVWHDQMGRFIERAAGEMDFLSVHLYTTHWDHQTKYRFGSNVDAILDLMESQSVLSTGQVKPLLISECGTGFKQGEQIMENYTPYRDWLVLRGANHIFMNLLKRDNRIAKMIPFLTLKARWYNSEHPYPWVLFHKHGEDWKPTHLSKWFDFWKDVQGRHLPTRSSNSHVQTHALLDGDVVYLMVDNLVDQACEFDVVSALPANTRISSVTISRLSCEDEEPCLVQNEQVPNDLSRLELGAHEALIARLSLDSIPRLDTTLVETTHYADQTMRPIDGETIRFAINAKIRPKEVANAKLRIGFGRRRELSQHPIVAVNGSTLEVPPHGSGEVDMVGAEIFTSREIEVPANCLRDRNQVTIQFPEAGGHVSSAILVVREEQPTASRKLATAH